MNNKKKISKITTKQIVKPYKNNPPIHAEEIFRKYYKGLIIEISGTVDNIENMHKYLTFDIYDEDNILIACNFPIPCNAEIASITKGEKIVVVGEVFNAGDGIVTLDDCKLKSEYDDIPHTKKNKTLPEEREQWWENSWVQIIFFLGAIAGIVGLILYFFN